MSMSMNQVSAITKMKMKKISRKLVKPHTPTPQNLTKYKLSFIDKGMVPMYNVAVLFYKYESKPKDVRQLEESLAKTLIDFYPLAGRYIKSVNPLVVDCNDEGVEFVEAEAAGVELIDLVGSTEIEQLIPDQYVKVDEADDDPLLSIQATRFLQCGGMAVVVCVSHRVFDGSSLHTFIAAWSSASKMVGVGVGERICPSYNLSTLLPCTEEDNSFHQYDESEYGKIVGRRLFFDKVALSGLISKIRPRSDGRRVSRARVVCAVVAKALIALDQAKHGRSRDFVISNPINMRERTKSLPQPRHSCGNFSLTGITRRVAASEAEHIGIQQLVDLMGDGIRKSISDYAEMLSPDRDGRRIYLNAVGNFMKEVCEPETHSIEITDMSKFGLYEADFGWGTPLWIAVPQPQRIVVLTSNKEGDGIEVLVNLYKDELSYFEQDQEIQIFMIDNAKKTTVTASATKERSRL